MNKELFLYTAKDCHLCLEMEEALQKVLPAKGVVFHSIDIGGDPELQHLYGARLPVLVAGNTVICELAPDMNALESFLANEID